MESSIWRVPDILVLCLKRFTFSNGMLDKIVKLVNFPLFAFDTSEWVHSKDAEAGLTLSTSVL